MALSIRPARREVSALEQVAQLSAKNAPLLFSFTLLFAELGSSFQIPSFFQVNGHEVERRNIKKILKNVGARFLSLPVNGENVPIKRSLQRRFRPKKGD